jgi:hypothetical protein
LGGHSSSDVDTELNPTRSTSVRSPVVLSVCRGSLRSSAVVYSSGIRNSDAVTILNIAAGDPDIGSILWKAGPAMTAPAAHAIHTPPANSRLQRPHTLFSSFMMPILPRVNTRADLQHAPRLSGLWTVHVWSARLAGAVDVLISSVSSLKERGRVKRGFYRPFVRVPGGCGHAGLARGPGVAAWGPGVPCSPVAADLG